MRDRRQAAFIEYTPVTMSTHTDVITDLHASLDSHVILLLYSDYCCKRWLCHLLRCVKGYAVLVNTYSKSQFMNTHTHAYTHTQRYTVYIYNKSIHDTH